MSSPDRGKLLAAVRPVDPSVTREQLDDWLETEREQTLTKVYYDPRGFGSIDRTFRDARRIDPWITREEVADFLRAQSIKQDLDKKRRLGTFLATAAREQIDIDVADFSNYGGVRYGLVAIDDFSKKLCVVPRESRRGTDMVQALDVVIQTLGVPVRFVSDEGGEFDNNAVLTYLRDMNVAIVFLRSYVNTAERVIGTIKTMLFPRVERLKGPWTDFIEDVVGIYNNTVHRTTGLTPNEAALDESNDAVRSKVMRSKRFRKKIRAGRRPPLDAGDLVKIMVPHSTVRRINTANFGPRPYRVEEVVTDSSGLKRYRVAGQLFLRHELLKVRDVQRNGETLESLKWMSEADLDKEFGGRRGRLGRALPGERGDVTQYSMLLQRVRGKQQPQVEVRERIDEDSEPLVLPKSNFEKLRDDLERERTPAAERAFYREIARLNGDASIAMKPSTRVKALNKALSRLGYGEKYDPDAEAVYREFLQVAPGVALKKWKELIDQVRDVPSPRRRAEMGAELKRLYDVSEEVRNEFDRRVAAKATLEMFVLEYDMLRRAYERSVDVDERAKYLTDIQAIIRYAQQENLPGLDYARIQENIREYEEGLALGNEQPALLQAIEIQIRNSDPLIQKLIK